MEKTFVVTTDQEKFNFRKVLRIETPEPWSASWDELHDTRSKIAKACEALLDKVEKDKRILEDDEQQAYDLANSYLDSINGEFRNRDEKATHDPIKYKKFYQPNQTYGKQVTNLREVLKPAKVSYRSIFYRGQESPPLDNGGFNSLAEFSRMIASGRYDERLEKRAFVEGDGVSGGFAVPEEFMNEIFSLALEESVLLQRAKIYPMKSNTLIIPAWNMTNHASEGLAGFSSVWTSEGGTATVQTGKLRSMTLDAKKLMIYTEASREVLADSTMLEQEIGKMLIQALGWDLDYQLINGNGIGKPQGVLNAPSTIKVTRNTGSSIVWADLRAMFAQLHKGYVSDAIWIANFDTLPQFLNMTVNNYPVFSPFVFTGTAGDLPTRLFGLPLIFTEKCPALGSLGDLILCNPTQYAVGMRQTIAVERTNAANWSQDMTSFRSVLRADGQALWDEAVTPRNGANTLSWAIALQ